MGTDDTAYTNKRNIANISRNLLAASTTHSPRSNFVSKFVLLFATVALLVYVLLDHVPSTSLSQIQAAARAPKPSQPVQVDTPVEEPVHEPPSVDSSVENAPVTKLVVEAEEPPVDDGAAEDATNNEDAQFSEEERMKAEQRVERVCNNTIAGRGEKTTMHDVLQYVSIVQRPITYLDVGANVGSTSLPVALCFEYEHRVLAVEPVKVNFEAIARGKQLTPLTPLPDDRFLAANVGFSDETKLTKMWIPGKRGDNAALSEKASTTVFKGDVREETVHVYRGDEFLNMHGADPDLIKVDVQGSEIRVLRGMEQFLRKRKNLLIMAEHDDRLLKNSGFESYVVYDFMKALGFKIYFRPKVTIKEEEYYVDSEEMAREDCSKIRGDLVYWKDGSA